MAASVAFVKLKPSGYVRTRLPGSPGRPKGGWTGFKDKFPVPQLPTQKELTSDMSIQMPDQGTSLWCATIESVHQDTDSFACQSGKTV